MAPTGYRLFIRGFSKKERSALRRELFGVARDLPQRERVEEEGRRGRGEDGEGEERGGGEVREVGGGLSGELFTETESEEDEVQGGKGKRERKRWEGVGGEM